MNENLFIASVVIISTMVVLSTIYLVKKFIVPKLNVKMIKYKQQAYKIFMFTTFLTFIFAAISIMLIINEKEMIWFHLFSIFIFITSLYYNYLNREALLNKIDLKAYYE